MGNDKLTNKKNNASGGLRRLFLTMTVLPILVLGLFIIAADYKLYSAGLQQEVERGLMAVGNSVLVAYEDKYPGDYNLLVNENTGEQILKKGDSVIDDDVAIIDNIKEKTGVDITLFFYDTRMMTTIMDDNQERVTGSVAHLVVRDAVLTGKSPAFFNEVNVGGKSYFAQYIPLFSKSGVCVGMIGAAKPTSEVMASINHAMLWNIILIIVAILLAAAVINGCTLGIVRVLYKMKKFLGEIADGNLSTRLDETVLKRADEIGDIGRFTEHVQASLRKLIERDPLTGLYNRRSGMNKIIAVRDKGEAFAVAMGDIDFFKKVNDTYGHDAGDEVLRSVARVLGDNMAGKGFVARWGGEEFLMVFEKHTANEAAKVLQSMLDTIRAMVVTCNEYEIKVTMSYGVTNGDVLSDVDSQIKKADNGLYYAKTHGRNQVVEVDLLEEREVEDNPDNTLDSSPVEKKAVETNKDEV